MALTLEQLELRCELAVGSAEKVAALNALSDYLCDRDAPRAHLLSQKALSLLDYLSNPGLRMAALLSAADVCYANSLYNEADTHATAALEVAHQLGARDAEARGMGILGRVHRIKGSYSVAHALFQESLERYTALGNQRGVAEQYTNIGTVYGASGRYAEELAQYQRALEMMQGQDDSVLMSRIYQNMAVAHSAEGRSEQSIACERQAIAYAEQSGDVLGVAYGWDGIATQMLERGDETQAALCYEKARSAAQAAQSGFFLAYLDMRVAQMALKSGDAIKAAALLHETIAIFEGQGAQPDLEEVYTTLAEAYEMLNDPVRALHYHKLAFALHKQIHDERKQDQLQALQAIYEVESSRLEAELYKTRMQSMEREMSARAQAEHERIAVAVEHERAQALRTLFTGAYHDLITPITILQTSIDVLDRLPNGDGRAVDKRRVMRHQLGALTRKLQNMILMARLDGNIPDLLRIGNHRLSDMFALAVSGLHLSPEQRARLYIPALENRMMIAADGDLFSRAIANLIDNALRYSLPPLPVRISVEFHEDVLEIAVLDEGSGVAITDLPRIFERYYRGEAHRPSDGSSGLGLPMAQVIIEKHGGTLRYTPNQGGGSRFSLHLPYAHQQSAIVPAG